MSYQPPGSFPALPQYPATTPAPQMPRTVRGAFYCMLGGAALTVIGAGLIVSEVGTIRSSLQADQPADSPVSINTLVDITVVVACVVGVIGLGLWVWMAFANKAGKNWARILGTVLFGVNTLSLLGGKAGVYAYSNNGSSTSSFSGSQTVLGQIVGWLTFAAGLAAIVLLWHKASGRYFKPQQQYAVPYGYGYGYPMSPGVPGQPPYPYPYPYPVAPGQPGVQPPPQGPGAGAAAAPESGGDDDSAASHWD